MFSGDVSVLIPLFAVGLFLAFTLSQAGMVVHHWRLREAGWRRRLAINAVGAAATAVVTIVVVVSKFTEGAWIPTVVIPVLVLLFWSIKRHYDASTSRSTARSPGTPLPHIVHTVVVLVGESIHAGVLESLAYAKSLRPHYLHAVHVSFDAEQAERMQENAGRAYGFDIPLDICRRRTASSTRPVLRVRRRARPAVEVRAHCEPGRSRSLLGLRDPCGSTPDIEVLGSRGPCDGGAVGTAGGFESFFERCGVEPGWERSREAAGTDDAGVSMGLKLAE